MEILRQLEELFLAAAPTSVVLFLFYLFLRASFFRPIDRVLAERKARTEGAKREAETAEAAAKEKNRTHQEAVKKARAELYAEQEAARRAVLEERAAAIRDTRARATETIRAEKERIAAEMAQARRQLEQESEALGGEIVQAILGAKKPPIRKEAR